ncbi:MAG: replication protein RepA [Rhodospirillales bacterium]|nr:replication protein RepA [Rhodospirillales bacterium]
MSRIHDLVLTHGRDVARSMVSTKHEKLAIDMAAEILAEESERLGITHSGFCLTALPYKDCKQPLWRKEGHKVTLLVESGRDRNEDYIGIPYGAKARVQLLYLQTRAIQTNNPVVELGGSLHEFLRRVGISVGGSQYAEIRKQARRISACRLTFLEEDEVSEKRSNGAFVENAIHFKEKNDARQGTLWQDTVELNGTFFKKLKEHPVPVWEPALRQIIDLPVAIDIYIWLAYRLHAIDAPTSISWLSLHQQFGGSYKAVRQFRPEFLRNLTFALAVYPEAKVEEGKGGLVLHPSRPPIPESVPYLPWRKR